MKITMLVVFVLCIATACYAEERRVYGPGGEDAGYSQDHGGNTTYFYGADGEYKGYSRKPDANLFGSGRSYSTGGEVSDESPHGRPRGQVRE